jgi:hypothetical protein
MRRYSYPKHHTRLVCAKTRLFVKNLIYIREVWKLNVNADISARCLCLAGCLLGLVIELEDGNSTFLRNVGEHLPDYMHSNKTFFILIDVRVSNSRQFAFISR